MTAERISDRGRKGREREEEEEEEQKQLVGRFTVGLQWTPLIGENVLTSCKNYWLKNSEVRIIIILVVGTKCLPL